MAEVSSVEGKRVLHRANDLIGLAEVSVRERGNIRMPVNAIPEES